MILKWWSQNVKKAFIIGSLSSLYPLTAQDKFSEDLHLAVNYHYGYLIPEYSNFLYLAEKPIQSVSINVSKKTTGKSDWEQIYNYPAYGVSLFYSSLGNDKVHGHEVTLFPYCHLNIVTAKKFNLYNNTGIGLSYVTRKFDLQDNYLNIAVGSNLNLHFNMKFGVSYQVFKKIQVHAGVSFDHFSNGNLSEPNLGLNYLTAFSGLDYLIGQSTERQRHELKPHTRNFYFEAVYSVGSKHPRALNDETYFTSSATFETKWRASRVFNLGFGADLFYDTSTEVEMTGTGKDNFTERDNFRTGIHLSQEFIYNRLSIIFQEGFYVFLTDQVNHKTMYNRGIVRFRATDHLFVQVAMKSHLHILDYPELGLGWKWQ
jgi:hypothetical protein